MKIKAIALALLFGITLVPSASAEQEYLLRLEREDRLSRVLTDRNLTLVRSIDWIMLHVVTGPPNMAPDALETWVRSHNDVLTFQRDFTATMGEVAAHPDLRETTQTLEDALVVDRTPMAFYGAQAWKGFALQPALSKIDVPAARSTGNIAEGIIVAVVDSGVDFDHPLLSGALVDQGWDFTRNQAGATDWGDLDQSTAAILDTDDCPWIQGDTGPVLDPDCLPGNLNQSTAAILDGLTIGQLDGHTIPPAFGHGTMVAGLIRAVAPGARILPVKAFNADGTGRSYDIAQAIYYAVTRGAKIINMSFTFTQRSDEVMYATAWAAQQGAVLVGSAGNRGEIRRAWPAEHKWVLSVGSTNLLDVRSPFSNHGYDVFKIGAPGEKLVTLYPGGRYASVSGTSFSSALVSGALALMKKSRNRLEWGASDDVMKFGSFAEIANVSRDASNRYPKRIKAPLAVQITPVYERNKVKAINSIQ